MLFEVWYELAGHSKHHGERSRQRGGVAIPGPTDGA